MLEPHSQLSLCTEGSLTGRQHAASSLVAPCGMSMPIYRDSVFRGPHSNLKDIINAHCVSTAELTIFNFH